MIKKSRGEVNLLQLPKVNMYAGSPLRRVKSEIRVESVQSQSSIMVEFRSLPPLCVCFMNVSAELLLNRMIPDK